MNEDGMIFDHSLYQETFYNGNTLLHFFAYPSYILECLELYPRNVIKLRKNEIESSFFTLFIKYSCVRVGLAGAHGTRLQKGRRDARHGEPNRISHHKYEI